MSYEQYDYDDVLICPAESSRFKSRSEVTPFGQYELNDGSEMTMAPVMAANMDGVGTFEMARILSKNRIMTSLTKHYSRYDLVDHFFKANISSSYHDHSMMTIGMSDNDREKFEYVYDKVPWTKFLTIDVANGHMDAFHEYVEKFVKDFPKVNIIAGNVASGETFRILQDLGVWGIKVGIGPGAHCATREKTGVGRKMVSLIEECQEYASESHIIADGGIKNPGDIAKAMVAGADLVMVGTIFAGHTEGGGERILKFEGTGEFTQDINSGKWYPVIEAREYRQFYGMSSDIAMNKHNDGVASHRTSEGKTSLVRFKGGVQGTIDDIFGGLRSACTYTDSLNPRDLFFASLDVAKI